MSFKLKIRGKEIEVRNDADAPAVQSAVDDMSASMDSGTAELAAVKQALMDALKKVAGLEAKIAAEEAAEGDQSAAPVTEDMIPEEVLDSALVKREKLRADARAVLGDDVFGDKGALKGKSDREIRAAVLAKIAPSVKLDAKDAKGEAVYDSKTQLALYGTAVDVYLAAKPQQKRADGLDAAHRIVAGPPPANTNERTDAADDSLEGAYEKMNRAALERGRAPLNGSK